MQRQLPDTGSGRRGAVADTADFIDGELPSRRDPIRWLVGCGILLIAAIAIGTAIMVDNFRDHALESSKRELENTVLLLAHHFDQQLEDAEVPLTHLIAQIHQAGIDTPGDFTRQMSTPEMHRLLKAKVGSGFSKIAGVNVYDAAGDLINSSEVAVVPAVNIADRAYFKALKASSEVERPQIELVRSRFTGGWRTLITRKVVGRDGEFLGVVSRAITPAKFEEFFSSVALGKDAAISMHHRDGALIARYPHVEEIIGKNFKEGSTPQAAFLGLDHGTARLISPIDGEERLVSVRSLSRFPLSVVATTTVASALADWRTQTRFLVVVAGLSAIVVAIILVLIVRRLSWQHLLSRRRLMLEKQRLDTAVDNMTQGLTLFNQSRQLIVCNQRYIEMYGLSPDTVKPGCSFYDLIAHRIEVGSLQVDDVEAHCARILELVARGEGTIINAPDGRSIQVTHRLLPDGGWVATHEDITERRRAEAEIVYLARHDVLTGLANRAEFNAKLEEASKRIKRNGGAVTVMMLDLDKFKAVNDTLGHPAGDQLLIEVGRRLQSTIRETDVLARLGGDEFAIIQEGGPDQHEGAIALALRIINAITQPFDLNGNQASVGTSIGIVLAPEQETDPEGLLKRADLALYDAKANGRNDFRIFQPEMLEVAHTQQSAESELRNAVARNEFELHYQPVVDIKTRLLCGVEALVRWKHPAKGLIAPDQFIPLAESTGLIVPLGEWILQRACTDAASWPAHIKVAVNISAVQFRKGNLFDVILCTLVETGLAPERLELEVTETALLENQEAHLTTIRQLKNLGVSVALDDFGTGYSSVSYLTNFPFDKIKIDKSFTQGVLHRRDCKAVVASTLALANGLGTVTTAEGVETEEQLEYMREAGVDLVQGYLFGRPVPISQLDLHNTSTPKEMVA